MKVNLITEVTPKDIADSFLFMTTQEAVNFILEVDLRISEWEFTEELIKALCKSLKNEKQALLYDEFLTDLKEI